MHPLHYLFHHLITNDLGLRKPWLEEVLSGNEPLLICLKVSNINTFSPRPCGKSELQVIAPVGKVRHCRSQGFLENLLRREEVLCHTQAQAEKGRAADHMIIRHDI